MMIYSNTICADRAVRIDSADESHFYWGSGVICCRECLSIVACRNAWEDALSDLYARV